MVHKLFSWRGYVLKSNLPPTTRHVLLTLACHMNDAGENCYPKIDTICQETGLSNKAVITHLKFAQNEGWIKVKKHGFTGQKWRNNEYELSWDHLNKKVVNVVHDVSQKVVNVVPKGSEPKVKKVVNEVHTSTSYSTSNNIYTSSKKLLSEIKPQIAEDFLRLRKAKKLPLTPTALKTIQEQADMIGATLEEVLTICCHRGWASFDASWSHGFHRPRNRIPDKKTEEKRGTKQGHQNGLKAVRDVMNA